jgi:hypothetical protein
MDLTRGRAAPPAPADTRREPAEAAARSAVSGTALGATRLTGHTISARKPAICNNGPGQPGHASGPAAARNCTSAPGTAPMTGPLEAVGMAIPIGAVAGLPAFGNGRPAASRSYAQAMEITTILPVRQLIIASQRAAAIVSQPRRTRHAIRVVLTRVGHGTLHYEARITRRQIRAVTVRFTQDPDITRVSISGTLDGAAAAFAAQLHQQIHAADPAADCSPSAAGTQAVM